MTRRLRVLAEHPHLGRPNDIIVREVPNAQAYVDIGVAEWIDDEPEIALVPVVVDRALPPETTTTEYAGGEIETTSPRPAAPVRGARGGRRPRTVEEASP